MENSLKAFLDRLVENKESFTLYKERFGVGATRLMLYLAVCHAYAGRKVLVLLNDDSSSWYIAKNLHYCIDSMVGPDDQEAQEDVKDKIKWGRLSADNMATMTQRYTFNGVLEKADVIVSLSGNKFLEFAYNAQKTVLVDGGCLPKDEKFADFIDKQKPHNETDGEPIPKMGSDRKLCLSCDNTTNIFAVTDETGEIYTQGFDFNKMEFIKED